MDTYFDSHLLKRDDEDTKKYIVDLLGNYPFLTINRIAICSNCAFSKTRLLLHELKGANIATSFIGLRGYEYWCLKEDYTFGVNQNAK